MKDRLQQFLTLEQLSPARLSEIIGIQRSGLSHILSGRNKPGFEFIQRLLLKFPAINAEWLITGKGKMYKEHPSPSRELSLSPNDTSVLQSDFDTDVNNKAQPVDSSLFSNGFGSSETVENSINDNYRTGDGKKRILRKMIFVYSDGTFSEYSPSKD